MAIFLLGVVVTLIGCVAVLLSYAPAVAPLAEDSDSVFARMTSKLLRMLRVEEDEEEAARERHG